MFFRLQSIGWGDNWVKALERAIDECEDIVFVLSPDFCNSEWVEVERTSAIAQTQRAEAEGSASDAAAVPRAADVPAIPSSDAGYRYLDDGIV